MILNNSFNKKKCVQSILELNKANTQTSSTRSSSASNSGSNQNDQLALQETIWLMSQLMSIYFDSNETNPKFFEVDFKPTKTFKIVFECMANNSKREKVTYISLVHQYLAK